MLTGDFEEAARQFELSRQVAARGYDWALAYALAGLSQALIRLDRLEDVPTHLEQALQLAYRWEHRALILRVLSVIAWLYAARGENAQAAEAAAFVSQHPTAWQEDKQHMQELLDQLAEALPEAELVSARERAAQRELYGFKLQ